MDPATPLREENAPAETTEEPSVEPSQTQEPAAEPPTEETTSLRPDGPVDAGASPPAPEPPPPPVAEPIPPRIPPTPPVPPPAGPSFAPPVAKKPGRGCLFYFLLIFFIAVAGSVLLFLASIGMALSQTGERFSRELADASADTGLRETFVPGAGPADSDYKIALIEVSGVIFSGNGRGMADPSRIVAELDQARRDMDVSAVILNLNTPGGEVTASDEIYRAVRRCAEVKPVVACMRSIAASGGYYVAAGSDWIVANKHTMTGSIGVIMSSLNYADFLARWGLKVETIKSGKMKDMMAGSRPATDSERAYMQQLVQETFHGFASIVAEGRPGFATVDDVLAADFSDGRILTGPAALEAGLVDQIGYFDDAVAKAVELGGDAKLISYRQRPWFGDFLLNLKSEDHRLSEELVPAELRAMRPGCMYAIWPMALTGATEE
jgi:protease-4